MRIARTFRWVATALVLIACPALAESYYVEGEGGVPLAVKDVGPKDAPAILFLHGITMGAESFAPQFDSDLAERFRLIAFDLRGHGMSGKPSSEDAYIDPAIWAGDVRRVIAATGIRRPVIVAWSYGTLVASDYIRYEETENMAGLVLVGAPGGLVTPPQPSSPPDPDVLAELERSRSLRSVPSFDAQREAVGIVMPMLFHCRPDDEWLEKANMLGMMVPPYAQAALRKHPFANGDLLEKMRSLPVLIAHGAFDPSLPQAAVDALKAGLPRARAHRFDQAGHSPFAEKPFSFNAILAEFRESLMEVHDDQ